MPSPYVIVGNSSAAAVTGALSAVTVNGKLPVAIRKNLIFWSNELWDILLVSPQQMIATYFRVEDRYGNLVVDLSSTTSGVTLAAGGLSAEIDITPLLQATLLPDAYLYNAWAVLQGTGYPALLAYGALSLMPSMIPLSGPGSGGQLDFSIPGNPLQGG